MSERIQEIIKELRSMQNAAQVVLDSGFGTHEGEHDTVYRKRRNLAKDAADIIESLQRERQERENPKPLTVERMREIVLNHEDITRSECPSYHDVIAWQPLPEPYNPDHIREATKKVDQFREPTEIMQEDANG